MAIGKPTHQLFEGTAPAAGAAVGYQTNGDLTGILQFELTAGTCSFVIQGRLTPLAPWADLATTITEASPRILNLNRVYPAMRVLVTALAGGTLRVWVLG